MRYLLRGFLVAAWTAAVAPGCNGDGSGAISPDGAMVGDGVAGGDSVTGGDGSGPDTSPSTDTAPEDTAQARDSAPGDAPAVTDGTADAEPSDAPADAPGDGAATDGAPSDGGGTTMDAPVDGDGDAGSSDGAAMDTPADAAPSEVAADTATEDRGMATPATERPTARVTVSPSRIARGDGFVTVVTLDAAGSMGGGLSYQWSIPDGRFEPGSAATDPAVRVRLPGTADHGWSVRVRNALGEDAAAGIVRVNRAPVAVSGDGAVVAAGAVVPLDGAGSLDPDGDPLTYAWTLTERPEGSAAAVSGATERAAMLRTDVAGRYRVRLTVHDGLQASPGSELVVQATASDVDPPTLRLNVSPPGITVGATSRVCVTVTDGSALRSRTVTVGGTALTLDGAGCGTFTPTAPGRYEVIATVRDASDNVATARGVLFTAAMADDGQPRLTVTGGPSNGAVLTAPVDITGTATDRELVRVTVETSPHGAGRFTPVSTLDRPVTAGRLGTIDPTMLPEGFHDWRVCAEDAHGTRVCTTPPSAIEVPPTVTPRPGTVRLVVLDAVTRLVNVPLRVRRVYDSRDRSSGDFGAGWRLELEGFGRLSQLNDTSLNYEENGGCTFLPFRPRLRETVPHRWAVTLGPTTYRFRLSITGRTCDIGSSEASVTVEPETGTAATLEVLDAPTTELRLLFARGGVLVDNLGNLWQPQLFRLRTRDGTAYDIHRTRGVLALRTASGRSLTVTTAGAITESEGAALGITRDTLGRITRITLPDGASRTYQYNTAGDLVAATDFSDSTTRYRYDGEHLLLQVIDPRGRAPGTMEYDSTGRLVGASDAEGRSVRFEHADGRREVITDPEGRAWVFIYDERGLVVRSEDPLGGVRRYERNALGRVTVETDPLGNATRYEYDAAGNRTARVDALGNRWTTTFDSAGRPTRTTDPDGNTRTTTYNSDGDVTSITDPRGAVTRLEYDFRGNVSRVTHPLGGVETYTYDRRDRPTGMTDLDGLTFRLSSTATGERAAYTYEGREATIDESFDRSGRPTALRGPDGESSRVNFDASGLLTGTTDPLGRAQTVLYDARDLPVAFRDLNGTTTTVLRGPTGRPTAVTLGDGRVLDRSWDALGRMTRSTLPGGQTARMTYDAAGHITALDLPGRGAWAFTYNAGNRPVTVTGPGGGSARFEYSPGGRRTATVDALGRRTAYAYDPDGAPTELRDPAGGVTRITRDIEGHVTAVTNPRGEVTRMTYNPAGHLVSTTTPGGEALTCTYNTLGRLTAATLPSGAVWTYSYDISAHLTTRRFPWGGEERFEHDALGRQTRITDGTGQATVFTYDAAGHLAARTPSDPALTETRTWAGPRLVSARGPYGMVTFSTEASGRLRRADTSDGDFVAYTYDTAGRVETVGTPSGSVRQGWDPASGRLGSVEDPSAGRAEFTYDLAGQLVGVRQPGELVTTYTRDGRGELTAVRVTRAGATLYEQTVTRDLAGDVTALDETSGGATRSARFTYDARGHLSRETRGGTTLDYTYDRDGSLTALGSRRLTLDRLRPVAAGGATLRWDAAGRLVERSEGAVTERLRYDAVGRLAEVTRAGAAPARVRFTYDDQELLRTVDIDGASRRLLWDRAAGAPRLLEERAPDGALLVRYVYGPEGLVAVVEGSAARPVVRDALGSVVGVIDGGAFTARHGYTAFGEGSAGFGRGARLGFRGEYLVPELGLYFLRSRFYDPSLGRFLTPDAVSQDPSAPALFDPYRYVGNNPLRYTDPTGRFSLGELAITNIIAGVLAAIAAPILAEIGLLLVEAITGRDLGTVGGFNGFNAGVQLVERSGAYASTAGLGFGFDFTWEPETLYPQLFTISVETNLGIDLKSPEVRLSNRPINLEFGPSFSADYLPGDVKPLAVSLQVKVGAAARALRRRALAANAVLRTYVEASGGLTLEFELFGTDRNGNAASNFVSPPATPGGSSSFNPEGFTKLKTPLSDFSFVPIVETFLFPTNRNGERGFRNALRELQPGRSFAPPPPNTGQSRRFYFGVLFEFPVVVIPIDDNPETQADLGLFSSIASLAGF
ncbi:MAG: hypothetical protein HY909_31495 [Deltaproteobacteria bacterium]|nr:hypothetical protein [Deltaproteobacteria bacterium]